jgi:hypothetical protein
MLYVLAKVSQLGKYGDLRYLKKTKARTWHQCSLCSVNIDAGEYYYLETIENRFLHSLHAKRYCSQCYNKYGDRLLSSKLKDDATNKRSLSEYFKNSASRA